MTLWQSRETLRSGEASLGSDPAGPLGSNEICCPLSFHTLPPSLETPKFMKGD